VSIVEAADEAAKRGIPFFRYSPRELEQDIEVARRARRG
jgi:predicted HTH domain antitoxin